MKIKSKNNIDKSYAKHIIIILIVKAILFTGIWYCFFRNPIELNDKQAFHSIFFKDNTKI
jgi:hypothetical protein